MTSIVKSTEPIESTPLGSNNQTSNIPLKNLLQIEPVPYHIPPKRAPPRK